MIIIQRRAYILLLTLGLLLLTSCTQLGGFFGLKEQPRSLTERIALADASAQWPAKALGDWAQTTAADAASGILPKATAKDRVLRIRGYLCDLGLAGGAPPPDCATRKTPTARGLLAEAGRMTSADSAGADQRLGAALITINGARAFLRPYIKP